MGSASINNRNPAELEKNYIFKTFKAKNLENLRNAVIREISQSPREEVDKLFLEAAVDILQQTSQLSNVFNITTNIKNDTKSIVLNHDINQILSKYLPSQDIISLIKIAKKPLKLINNPLGSSHDIRNLEHQMSALGLEDQESSSGSILPAEPLMECSVKMAPETRKFS